MKTRNENRTNVWLGLAAILLVNSSFTTAQTALSTTVDFVPSRGNVIVYDLGTAGRAGDHTTVLPSQKAVGAITALPQRYTLLGSEHVFVAGNWPDSLGISRPVKVRNDGRPHVIHVRSANEQMYRGGRSALAPCLVMAILSALAAPIPFLLEEQNETTRLSGTVLIAGSGLFTIGTSLGVVFTRQGRAKLTVRRGTVPSDTRTASLQ